MPWTVFLTMIALVIAAGGLTVAALVWLPLPAGAVMAGLLAVALGVRWAVRPR